jgi:hypothetical protein
MKLILTYISFVTVIQVVERKQTYALGIVVISLSNHVRFAFRLRSSSSRLYE